jgi:hypothetical protein
MEDHEALVEINLTRALDLVSDCQAAYRSAPPLIRRLFNQVFFKKLYVEDESIRSELAEPFDLLLGTPRLPSIAPETGMSASETSYNDSDPETDGLRVAGVKETNLVAGAGFEPATSGL